MNNKLQVTTLFSFLMASAFLSTPAYSASTYTNCVLNLQDGRQAAILGTNDAQSCNTTANQCAANSGWQVQNTQFYTSNVVIDWSRQGGASVDL